MKPSQGSASKADDLHQLFPETSQLKSLLKQLRHCSSNAKKEMNEQSNLILKHAIDKLMNAFLTEDIVFLIQMIPFLIRYIAILKEMKKFLIENVAFLMKMNAFLIQNLIFLIKIIAFLIEDKSFLTQMIVFLIE